MTFRLTVDAPRLRAHLDRVLATDPRTVPVIKGNGYGLGLGRAAKEAARLGADTVAVGTAEEVDAVAAAAGGAEVLVLAPWHPAYPAADRPPVTAPGVVRTVSHAEAVVQLASTHPGTPVVVEVLTSMRRHGVAPHDLAVLGRPLDALDVRGFALHLPLDRGTEDAPAEVERWAGLLSDAGLRPRTLWVSHLDREELARVRGSLPGADVRPRVGTGLWLGDREALRASGTVLDVHAVRRGDRVGYRQRRAARDGHVVVVSGGTSHGVGLEAPAPAAGLTARGRVVARGGLEAAGRLPSPFRHGGRRLWFVEPPHMQVSMLWWAEGEPPVIGSSVDCRVRLTTAAFDEIVGLDDAE